MPYTQKYIFKRTLLVVLILTGLGVAIYPSLSAQADSRQCATAPVVHLTDGSSITLSTLISTDAAYIQKIMYTLHVPRGSELKGIVYTQGELGSRENVTVVADNAAGKYTSSTMVSVIATHVPVTTTLSLVDDQPISVSGYSNQRLVASIQ